MIKGYKYRIYPNNTQEKTLERQLWYAWRIYNDSLNMRKLHWQETGKPLLFGDIRGYWYGKNGIRNYTPELLALSADSIHWVVKRMDDAYKAFFRRVKNGDDKPGFPRENSFKFWDSVEYSQGINLHSIHGKRSQFAKLNIYRCKDIRLHYHRSIPDNGTIKHCTIKRERGEWFAVLTVDLPEPKPGERDYCPVGIDMGLVYLVALSDRVAFDCPRPLIDSLAELRRLQRKLTRQEVTGYDKNNKPVRRKTKRSQKTRKRITKLFKRTANQREYIQRNIVSYLCETYTHIVMEEISPQFMIRNKRLAKYAADAAWSQFVTFLQQKADETGVLVEFVPAHHTSQACWKCGHVSPENRKRQELFSCENCGYTDNADIHAAQNILLRSARFTEQDRETLKGKFLTGERIDFFGV